MERAILRVHLHDPIRNEEIRRATKVTDIALRIKKLYAGATLKRQREDLRCRDTYGQSVLAFCFGPARKIICVTNSAHGGNVTGRQCQNSTD